jgi:hypothetical protein
LVPAGLGQVNLREDQVEGGRGTVRGGVYPIPISPVLGKLIAGDNRPAPEVYPGGGEDNFGNRGAQRREALMNIVHGAIISPGIVFVSPSKLFLTKTGERIIVLFIGIIPCSYSVRHSSRNSDSE